MVSQDIEVSKEGIKIPYRLFLSDSAAGYIAILIVIFSYYYPIFGKTLQEIFPHLNNSSISIEVKIFVLLLVFLLSTPLGLAINAFSFIILGSLQIWSETRWFNVKNSFFLYIIDGTKKKLLFDDCKKFYQLEEKNWHEISVLIDEMLSIYQPDVVESSGQLLGIYIFFRNIIFLLIVIILINFFVLWNDIRLLIMNVGILFLITIILTIVMSVLAFYYHLLIIMKGYLLCRKNEHYEELKCNIEKIIIFLSKKNKDEDRAE